MLFNKPDQRHATYSLFITNVILVNAEFLALHSAFWLLGITYMINLETI